MTALPIWTVHLAAGIGLFALLSCAAVVLSRAGRNPYAALLLLVPFVQIIALWLFAFRPWPNVKKVAALVLVSLCLAAPARAAEFCAEQTLVREILCKTGGLLPLEDCKTEPFCAPAPAAPAPPQKPVAERAHVEERKDAPKGFQEQILIVE